MGFSNTLHVDTPSALQAEVKHENIFYESIVNSYGSFYIKKLIIGHKDKDLLHFKMFMLQNYDIPTYPRCEKVAVLNEEFGTVAAIDIYETLLIH